MKVTCMHHTPLEVALVAGLTCTASADRVRQYAPEPFLNKLIAKGHESVIEHLVYTFKVEGISRAVLQELARHRIMSLSVESTRWALHKCNNTTASLLRLRWEKWAGRSLDDATSQFLESLVRAIRSGEYENDILKYLLPELWPTNLVMTINARSLRNMFKLRANPPAFKEFNELMKAIYEAMPYDDRFLVEGFITTEPQSPPLTADC